MKNSFCIKGNITEIYWKEDIILIDTEDLNKVSRNSWHTNNKGYAMARVDTKLTLLHRLILEIQDEERKTEIDHINKNKLDNRKENLRICSRSENMQNTKIPTTNTSGYKGVCYDKRCPNKPWYAQMKINQKQVYFGHYATKEEAILARKNGEEKYFK